MATNTRKFLFDQSFDQPDTPVQLRLATSAPEPRYSRDELDAAKAAAFDEGRSAGHAAAAASIEQQLATATEALVSGIASLIDRVGVIRRETERSALELMREFLGKAFPALSRVAALPEIEIITLKCLEEALDEPRVVVRVPPALFEPMRERTRAIAERSGFAGNLVLLAEEGLGPADCRVEWADGGAERNCPRIEQDIAASLERALATLSDTKTDITEETNSDRPK